MLSKEELIRCLKRRPSLSQISAEFKCSKGEIIAYLNRYGLLEEYKRATRPNGRLKESTVVYHVIENSEVNEMENIKTWEE